ncbi:MAG: hypothetical protein ABSD74_08050 [Rhizomicrobium sp.]|jgi:hypothetical protein
MGKVALAAAAGMGVAGILLAMMYLGIQLPPALLMNVAAALSVGAAAAVLTRYALDRPKERPRGNELLVKRIRDVKEVMSPFPKGSGAVLLSIKPDTPIDELEVLKTPSSYAAKEIVVTLKDTGKGTNNPAHVFNPVTLKKLFVALKDQPNFLHIILIDKHDEFVGYIPSFRAKTVFTGGGAESAIVKYVIDVFADPAKSITLHEIDGLSNNDVINDEETLGRARGKMEGGFHHLVVLHGGRHRKPIGLLHSEQLLTITKPAAA